MLPCCQQVCGQHHAKGETFLQWWSGLLFGESSASWRIGPTWISFSSMQTNTNSGPGTEQHQESMQVSNWLRSSSAEKEEDAVGTARCRRASRILGYHKGNSILSCSSKRTATNSWQLIEILPNLIKEILPNLIFKLFLMYLLWKKPGLDVHEPSLFEINIFFRSYRSTESVKRKAWHIILQLMILSHSRGLWI